MTDAKRFKLVMFTERNNEYPSRECTYSPCWGDNVYFTVVDMFSSGSKRRKDPPF